jgi:hypothetical protein
MRRTTGGHHPDDEALLSHLISARQGADERAGIEQHLLHCDRCVAVLAVAQARLALADEVPAPLPAHLFERAERLARAVVAPEPSPRPGTATSFRGRRRGWLAGIRDRLESWSRLPVLVPASFAIGVLIMVFADRTLMRPGMVEPARRSITLEPTQLVTRDTAVVRAQPSGNAAIIATLAPGDVVAVDHEEREWYRARLSDGREGWIERRAFE